MVYARMSKTVKMVARWTIECKNKCSYGVNLNAQNCQNSSTLYAWILIMVEMVARCTLMCRNKFSHGVRLNVKVCQNGRTVYAWMSKGVKMIERCTLECQKKCSHGVRLNVKDCQNGSTVCPLLSKTRATCTHECKTAAHNVRMNGKTVAHTIPMNGITVASGLLLSCKNARSVYSRVQNSRTQCNYQWIAKRSVQIYIYIYKCTRRSSAQGVRDPEAVTTVTVTVTVGGWGGEGPWPRSRPQELKNGFNKA